MASSEVYEVPKNIAKNAHIDSEAYEAMYRRSLEDPDGFWGEHGKRIDWIKPYTKVSNASFTYPDISIKWYEDGELNVCANCIDRHLDKRGEQTAIIWESDDPEVSEHISYRTLHEKVCRMANVFKSLGVGKGDRICIYMPMIPEAAYAMLACARIGAIHSVVFGGFSPEALANRINDCSAKLLVTADGGPRGGKTVPLKANADLAMERVENEVKTLVVKRVGQDVPMRKGRDFWYHEEITKVTSDCPVQVMNAEDPLFILYTSGSTGKPKGVLHSSGGYLVYASMTHQYAFDYHDGDIYWCTADVGWVTGHSCIVYGPLANGATILMFEGVPTYPTPARFWQICEKHKVNIFYTAPTAIRSLMGAGDHYVQNHDLSSLRILATVGEPINPKAWHWYHNVVGKGKCPVIDTWWQTETGSFMITPLPGATPLKPGSASKPFFGIDPVLVDVNGKEVKTVEGKGVLCIRGSWPGQMRTVFGDHDRFVATYFSDYKGYYFSGDGCKRDADGYYWITGRVDDVMNISGHRLGTAEVESALVAHPKVSEAAVVGYPHKIKGQGIYCYVTLMEGEVGSEGLLKELRDYVRKDIGPIATPDYIQWAPGLPKTRSGKIMRRILRKIAENDTGELGDTSTLADPSVVQELIASRLNR